MKHPARYILLLTLAAVSLGMQGADSPATDSPDRYTAEQLMEQGRTYFEQRKADEALRCFTAVTKRYENGDSIGKTKLTIRALNNIACVYKYFYYDYIKAYDYFTKAYRLCEAAGDEEFLPIVMVNLGDLLNDYGINSSSQVMSQQAQEMFDKCMEHAAASGNWELMTTAFFNLSNQNYTLDLKRYERLLDSQIPDSTPDLEYVRLQYRGLEQLQQGNYARAREYFMRQFPAVSARWEPERDTLATYMNIAYTYRMEGDYRRETLYLDSALQLAVASNVSDQAAGIRHQMTEAQAHELSERQLIQQMAILFIGIVLLIVIGSAILLWRKNRQLSSRNRSLYEKNRQLLYAEQQEQQLRKEYETGKYSRSSLNDEHRSTLLSRIQDLLSDPEVFCQPDYTLAKLAKMADSNTTYVSQAVNQRYGTAFSNLLASLRIKEACRRMVDEQGHYSQLTIEAIATSVGFKSRTAFINAFKREVGLTPSEYLRIAQSQKNEL